MDVPTLTGRIGKRFVPGRQPAISFDVLDSLPDGPVTFLFTDVEGSTRLWEEAPESMLEALSRHDELISDVVERCGGLVVKPRGEGDSQFVVFRSAVDATTAVAEIQTRLAATVWPTPRPIRVRASVHTGTADLVEGDYYGSAVNRAARLRATAHGGQTVMSGSTYELVCDHIPDGITLVDMGPHRLKDLVRPEHVYQVNIDGLPTSFPPLASLDITPNNLPVQLTELMGRANDLEVATENLKTTRLVTILAPGGAGKTRLAIQLAAEVSSGYPDGVFFVDLSPLESADEMIQAIGESLSIALSTEEDPKVQLMSYLARKRQLLVLDNFEHVVSGADLVTEILTNAQGVTIVVTSRTKLNVVGELVQPLPGLDTKWEGAEDAFATSGVQLFVDAARRADSGFTLTADDLEPLGQILETVGGMPLGIELAAAWVDVLTIAEIDAEINKSLDFLESEAHGIPDRHRSVRAVFDYSWAMLSLAERQMFSALSLFRGGFTREAAESVAGASIRNLANLTNKSLLVFDREAGRYSVHELLRQYAEAELARGDGSVEVIAARHTTCFASLAARAAEAIAISQKETLQILEDDLDNVRVAWRRAVTGRDAASAAKFVKALWFLYEVRGWHQAGADLLGEALTAFGEGSDEEATVKAWALTAAAQGWFLCHLGQAVGGEEQVGRAVDALRRIDDRDGFLLAVQCHCAALTYLSRWDDLVRVGMEGVEVARAAGDEMASADPLVWSAVGDLRVTSPSVARAKLEEADRILAAAGEHRARTWTLFGLALIDGMEGKHKDAIRRLQEVVELAKQIGYRRAIQAGLQYLGEALVNAGDAGASETVFLESLAMSEDMGQSLEMAGTLSRLASAYSQTGQEQKAVEILASVLADPSTATSLLAEESTVAATAQSLLDQLRDSLDGDTFEDARARGSALPIQVTAKQLLIDA
ncbi:MAG TPA: adenylate/guanylate cyclase domain-containing protein [Acidimicrobiia bacterium]|nr:adenylate/guanylate cyclase domain-containing protein [Acidimicrobiia bacterium]